MLIYNLLNKYKTILGLNIQKIIKSNGQFIKCIIHLFKVNAINDF